MKKNCIHVLTSEEAVTRISDKSEVCEKHNISASLIIYYVLEGSINVSLNKESFEVSRSCACVIPQFTFFDFIGHKNTRVIFVRITPEICDEVGISGLEGFELVCRDSTISSLFSDIEEESKKKQSFSKEYVNFTIIQLLIHLYRRYRQKSMFSTENQSFQTCVLVREAISHIILHYSEKLSTSDIAEALFISSSYLDRCFKAVTGKSPVTFIKSFRCEAAQILLDEGYSKEKAAFECGFSGSAYFMRVLRSSERSLPKQNKKAESN